MKVVVQFIAFFKIYFEYCNDYNGISKAEELIMKTSPEYVEFFK